MAFIWTMSKLTISYTIADKATLFSIAHTFENMLKLKKGSLLPFLHFILFLFELDGRKYVHSLSHRSILLLHI